MRRVNRSEKARVTLTLNGRKLSAEAEPRLLLTDFLRHALGATGTHVGCEHGICGCCTVLIDGVAARSCLTLAVQVEGREVTTVESLAAARRHAQSAAAGVSQQSRAAMRLLHAGHSDVVYRLSRPQSAANDRGDPRSLERASVPLHRLCRHRCGGGGSGQVGAVTTKAKGALRDRRRSPWRSSWRSLWRCSRRRVPCGLKRADGL